MPAILLPLMDGAEYDDDDTAKMYDDLQYLPADKKREPDSAIRFLLVECVKLLCSTPAGRNEMRTKGVVSCMIICVIFSTQFCVNLISGKLRR